jgi:hypothetical protein
MGSESFRVELRGGQATYPEAIEIVRLLPHIEPDQQAPSMRGSTFFLFEDGQHIVELEVMDSPVKLSCRFTLCHPPSVDAAFLAFVRDLMSRLGMEVRICDDVPLEHSRFYSLADYATFAAVTERYIAARRAEWIVAFGTEQLAATTSEVHRRIILPRCEPVVGPLGRE